MPFCEDYPIVKVEFSTKPPAGIGKTSSVHVVPSSPELKVIIPFDKQLDRLGRLKIYADFQLSLPYYLSEFAYQPVPVDELTGFAERMVSIQSDGIRAWYSALQFVGERASSTPLVASSLFKPDSWSFDNFALRLTLKTIDADSVDNVITLNGVGPVIYRPLEENALLDIEVLGRVWHQAFELANSSIRRQKGGETIYMNSVDKVYWP